jgi:hypothetical protein
VARFCVPRGTFCCAFVAFMKHISVLSENESPDQAVVQLTMSINVWPASHVSVLRVRVLQHCSAHEPQLRTLPPCHPGLGLELWKDERLWSWKPEDDRRDLEPGSGSAGPLLGDVETAGRGGGGAAVPAVKGRRVAVGPRTAPAPLSLAAGPAGAAARRLVSAGHGVAQRVLGVVPARYLLLGAYLALLHITVMLSFTQRAAPCVGGAAGAVHPLDGRHDAFAAGR